MITLKKEAAIRQFGNKSEKPSCSSSIASFNIIDDTNASLQGKPFYYALKINLKIK